MSGSSYYSQNDFRLHFGLGRAAKADLVELAWPSGVKETFRDLPANHLFVSMKPRESSAAGGSGRANDAGAVENYVG